MRWCRMRCESCSTSTWWLRICSSTLLDMLLERGREGERGAERGGDGGHGCGSGLEAG